MSESEAPQGGNRVTGAIHKLCDKPCREYVEPEGDNLAKALLPNDQFKEYEAAGDQDKKKLMDEAEKKNSCLCGCRKVQSRRKCGVYCGSCACILAVLFITLQGIMYSFATMQCGPHMLANYHFPGGQPGPLGTSVSNLVPQRSLLDQSTFTWSGEDFQNIPANDNDVASDAASGTWSKTWGPIFDTYVYQDQHGQPTMYVRRNLMRIGGSWSIFRCDELSDSSAARNCTFRAGHPDQHQPAHCSEGREHFYSRIEINEGGYYIRNAWHRFWNMNQGAAYSIYLDGELAATANEINGDMPSLSFTTGSGSDETNIASANLLSRNYLHNSENKDQWLVKTKSRSNLPYYVPNALTVIYAFATAESQIAEGLRRLHNSIRGTTTPSPGLLAAKPVMEKKLSLEAGSATNADVAVASVNTTVVLPAAKEVHAAAPETVLEQV